jgi:hypothetical protein
MVASCTLQVLEFVIMHGWLQDTMPLPPWIAQRRTSFRVCEMDLDAVVREAEVWLGTMWYVLLLLFCGVSVKARPGFNVHSRSGFF